MIGAVVLATYSIVATDAASRQVGGAGASCVGSTSVLVIYGAAPGHGAVHAQAWVNTQARNEAVYLLGQGTAPAEIIAAITAPTFDANAQARQYGVVDLMGRAAGFTGSNTMPFADDVQATFETYTYSVQGNILTSGAVLSQAMAAFEGGGCDLADKLMLALEAGAQGGEGDTRCTGDGIPADSAFIEVDLEGQAPGSYLQLQVTGTRPLSPLPMLRAMYDEWRLQHPCPQPPQPDAGPGDEPDAGPAVDDGDDGDDGDDAGCGCRAGGAGDGSATVSASALAALALALLGRRRRA